MRKPMKEAPVTPGDTDALLAILEQIQPEGWTYIMVGDGDVARLDLELFDGVLTLGSNGTWSFVR